MALLQEKEEEDFGQLFDLALEAPPEKEEEEKLDEFGAMFDLAIQGPPGIVTPETQAAAGLARERAGVERRNVERLELLGVDVETGGPAGLRAELSLLPAEKRTETLQNIFGEGNFQETQAGIIVNTKNQHGDSKPLLLDERGFSFGDIADAADLGIEIAGNIAGGLGAIALFPEAAATSVIGLAGLAAFSAVGGQTAAGGAELLVEMKENDLTLDDVGDVVKRRGLQAGIDFLLEFIGGGAIKVGSKLVGVANAPLAQRLAAADAKAALEAERRLGITALSPGEASGQETLIAAESLASKVPGARGPAAKAKREAEEALRGKEQELVGDVRPGAELGEEVKGVLEQNIAAAETQITDTNIQNGMEISRNLERLSGKLDQRPLSTGEAGDLVRQDLVAKREAFNTRQKQLSNESNSLINVLPEAEQKFASTGKVKAVAKKLIDEFPKKEIVKTRNTGVISPVTGKEIILEEVVSGPNPVFLPGRSRRFLKEVADLPDNASITELRRVRQSINTAISDTQLFPGVDTGQLKLLSKALTREIRAGIGNAPTPEIRKALTKELDHYANNIDQFQDRAVARAFRSESDPGFTEPEKLLPDLLVTKGKAGEAERIIKVLGPESDAVKGSQRAAFDELVNEATDLATESLDALALLNRLNSIGPRGRRLLFGSDEAAEEGIDLLKLMGAQSNTLDLQAIRVAPARQSMLDTLKDSARAELQLREQFNNKLVRGLTDSPEQLATIAPENIVRYTLKTLSKKDAVKFMELLPPDLQNGVRAKMVQFIVDASGRAKSARLGNTRPIFEEGAFGDGKDLLQVMLNSFADVAPDSIAKIEAVLGKELTQSLKDVAILRARKAQGAGAASAAGGLVGGTILSNMMSLQFTNASKIVKFKGMAVLYNLPGFQKWLKRTRNIKDPSAKRNLAAVIFPKFIQKFTEEVSDDPDIVAEVEQGFRDALGIGDDNGS